MSLRLQQLLGLLLSLWVLAGSPAMQAAPGGNKDWKGDNGNSNDNTKWLDGLKPGRNDVVKVTNGRMNIVIDEVWGALDFQGGTIDGAKKVSLLSIATSSWTGGDFDTVSVTTSTGTSLTIGSGTNKNLKNNAKFDNVAGSNITWTGSDITTGNGAQIANAGSFTITGSGKIAHDASLGGSRSTFTNTGDFHKNTDLGTAELETVFNNTGNVTVGAGTLKLSGGGSSAGHVAIDSGATLQVATTDFTFSGSALNGAGTIDIAGGTTTFNATSGSASLKISGGKAKIHGSHATTGSLSLAGGTLEGTGTDATTVGGGFNWTAGDISGTIVTSTGGGTIGPGAAKKLLGSAQLNLAGTTTWTGDTIAASGGAKITNSGTFVTHADATLVNEDTTGNRPSFKNDGTFTKAATNNTAGTTEVQASFDNSSSGLVNIHAGRLKLSGGGTSSGNVTLAGTSALEITGENYAFTGGVLNGSGTIEINGATATLANTSGTANVKVHGGGTLKFDAAHHSSGKLTLHAGSVTGTGAATIGSFEWTGGTLGAELRSTGSATIGGTGAKFLGGNLALTGATTWDGSQLHAEGAGKIINETGATFSATADGAITNGGSASFVNRGTFEKTGAGNTSTDLDVRFENTGELRATTGTLKLRGGGNSSNVVTIGQGAKLEISGADFAFTGGAINGPAGTLALADQTTTFTQATSGDVELAVTGSGATARFDGTHVGTGKLSLAAGAVTGNGTAEFAALDWSGGSLGAKVTTHGATTIAGAGSKSLAGELILGGDTTWDSSLITTTTGAKIRNQTGKTFAANGDGSLTGTGTFRNEGTFAKSTGTTDLQTTFDNTGALHIAGGKLKLSGGGISTNGSVTVGGILEVGGQGYTFDGSTLAGSGSIELTAATTKFRGASSSARLVIDGGKADFDTSESVATTLALASGSLGSTNGGSATVTSLEWTGGTLDGRVSSAGATIGPGQAKHLGSAADLTLAGTTSWDGSALNASGNARIRNAPQAVFLATADGLLAGTSSSVFTNDGTFVKSAGSGDATRIQTRFENNGTVNVAAGKLHLSGGGRNSAHASILVDAGAALEIAGDLELAANSALNGNGLGRLLSGTLTAHGDVGIRNFSFEGGSLGGSHTFHGNVEWIGGNWNSAHPGATTTIANTGVLHLRSNATHDFAARSIFNDGTLNWHAGDIRGGDGSVFTNDAVFNDLTRGGKAFSSVDGSASFTNNGAYRKTNSGITTIDVPFTNNGSLEISAGSIVFSNTFTNAGSINLTHGASAAFALPLSFGADAPLSGVGTITAPSVTAAGDVAPGVSPGALHLTGDLTLLATSSLLIELGGPVQGSDYDFLSVGGTALLGGGSLDVVFLNGYQWQLPPGATFRILTANTALTGAFGNVGLDGRLATLDGAATFQVNYALNSVVLSNFVVAVPEPSTYAMIAIGGAVILFSVRRRRK